MSAARGKEANEQIGKEDGASRGGPRVWRLTAKGRAFEPLPGVPWEEMDEVRFAVVSAEHSRRHGFEAGSLERSGFFELVPELPSPGLTATLSPEGARVTGSPAARLGEADVADEYDRGTAPLPNPLPKGARGSITEVTDGAG